MSRTMLNDINKDHYSYVMNQLNADWKAIPYLIIEKSNFFQEIKFLYIFQL